MLLLEKISHHLISKYAPMALLLHGSRARGDHVQTSDYDIIVVCNEPDIVVTEIFENHTLDLMGTSPQIQVLKSGHTPLYPLQILYNNEQDIGKQLVRATQAAFDQGPNCLTPQEWGNRRHYTQRLLNRLRSRNDDKMLRYYYLSDLYDRMIRYWFEKNQIWTMSAYRALPHIKANDSEYYHALENLWKDQYYDNACLLFTMIFESQD